MSESTEAQRQEFLTKVNGMIPNEVAGVPISTDRILTSQDAAILQFFSMDKSVDGMPVILGSVTASGREISHASRSGEKMADLARSRLQVGIDKAIGTIMKARNE